MGNSKKFKEITEFFRKVKTDAYPARTNDIGDIGKFFASKKVMEDLSLSFRETMRVWDFYASWKASNRLAKKISKLKPKPMRVRKKYSPGEEYKPHP